MMHFTSRKADFKLYELKNELIRGNFI